LYAFYFAELNDVVYLLHAVESALLVALFRVSGVIFEEKNFFLYWTVAILEIDVSACPDNTAVVNSDMHRMMIVVIFFIFSP